MTDASTSEAAEATFLWSIVTGLFALVLTLILGHVLERRHIHWLPEAGVGVLVGALCTWLASEEEDTALLADERFSYEFFLIWLLPPIILEAGYSIDLRAFFGNLAPTLIFAFAGTFLSTFVVGGLVYGAGQLGWCYPLGLLASLTFGALISATDPVSVLAVFQALGVRADLFSMVFGESVLNDAVAIVLVHTLLSFNHPYARFDAATVLAAFALFVTIFVGSMLLGVAHGALSALTFKRLDLRAAPSEATLLLEGVLAFAFPWAAFYSAEALRLSGIVTILFCGIFMSQYTRHNFSDEAATLTSRTFKLIAKAAETYVFVYLGMAVFTFPIFHGTVWLLSLISMLACLVGRLHIYLGSWLTNRWRAPDSDPPPISPEYKFVMWFSGLRGGVAFALASVSFGNQDFGEHCGGVHREHPHREAAHCTDPSMTDSLAVLQTTLLVAVFTIFAFGGAITDVSLRLSILQRSPSPSAREALSPRERRLSQAAIHRAASAAAAAAEKAASSSPGTPPPPPPLDSWEDFEARHLRPLFTSAPPPAETPWTPNGGERRIGVARSARRRRLALCVAALAVPPGAAFGWLWWLRAALEAECAPPPPPHLLWTHRAPHAAFTATDALLFGDHWAVPAIGGGLSWAQELSLQLGVPAERTVDCGAAGAPSRALATQLKRCARARGVAIGNGTVVVVHAGGDDDKDDGRGGVDGGHLLRALLLRGRAPPLEKTYERVLNFTAAVCDALGCPRAFVVASLPLARGESALPALQPPDPFLHERLPRAVDAAARCAAAGALHAASFRALVRGAKAAAGGAPLVLFNEALAVGGGGGGRSANWRIACEHAAACEAHAACRATLRVHRTAECAAAVPAAGGAERHGEEEDGDGGGSRAGRSSLLHLLLRLKGRGGRGAQPDDLSEDL